MNWDRIEGNWKQIAGRAMERWGALTHDRAEVIEGRRAGSAGRVQEAYGIARDAAAAQLGNWRERMSDPRRSA